MDFVRVFPNPNRCMQRLGFLKHLVWRASRAATNNLSSIGNDLTAAATQRTSAHLNPQLHEYIRKVLLGPKYKSLRETAETSRGSGTTWPKIEVELQDFYLAHLDVPSRRGKLVKDDWRRYPHFAVDLGLLRRGTYSLLVRGQAFLAVVPEAERKAFVAESLGGVTDSTTNPLRLSEQQRLLLLFSLVANDGDILRGLYARLLQVAGQFVDREAGDYLPEIYRQVAKNSRQKARSGDDLLRIQRLLDTANNIERWKGREYKGRGARDEGATIRLEPLVDLGLLSKPDPFAYRYQTTDATKTFFEPLIGSESIDRFLDRSFFSASGRALGLNGSHQGDSETILPPIHRAYMILKSPLGYVPIVEVALLAGIYCLAETGKYFEISEAVEALKSLQKEAPNRVTFNVDRWGGLSVVKFNDDLMGVTRT